METSSPTCFIPSHVTELAVLKSSIHQLNEKSLNFSGNVIEILSKVFQRFDVIIAKSVSFAIAIKSRNHGYRWYIENHFSP